MGMFCVASFFGDCFERISKIKIKTGGIMIVKMQEDIKIKYGPMNPRMNKIKIHKKTDPNIRNLFRFFFKMELLSEGMFIFQDGVD
jgi:hypothetical protein